ncbi:MAG: sel1 repeat family protein [Alphaproteobacteria bacterium]|nr:sel1 repeat family protein [Alphaproteobacteria bacterium]
MGIPVAALMLAAALWFAAGAAHARSEAPSGYTDTLRWYHEQARAGNPTAQFLLAIKYETGTDVPRDLARAADLYEKAARQGHADAQFKIATFLETGSGVARDDDAARTWYRAAALNGHAPAQFNLGSMLLRHAVDSDARAEGLSWLLRSADGGLAPARTLSERWIAVLPEQTVVQARELAVIPLTDASSQR